MDVVALALNLFGHLLASVLYVWSKIPFSALPSSDSVDTTSLLDNKDSLRKFWENKIMADEQAQNNGDLRDYTSKKGSIPSEDHVEKVDVIQNGHACTETKMVANEGGLNNDCEGLGKKSSHPDQMDVVGDAEEPDTLKKANEVVREIPKEDVTKENTQALESENSNPASTEDSVDEVILMGEKTETAMPESTNPVEDHETPPDDHKANCDNVGKGGVVNHVGEPEDKKVSKAADSVNVSETAEDVISKPAENVEDYKIAEDLNVSKIAEDVEVDLVPGTNPIEEFKECPTESHHASDETEQFLDDGSTTEAYYTSSFTFVCQKSHDKLEATPGCDDMEVLEADKDQEQSTEALQRDEKHDISATYSLSEVATDISDEVSHSDSLESRVVDGSDSDRECPMTGVFPNTDDEAGNVAKGRLDKEMSENESEVVSNGFSLGNDNDEDKDFPNRSECLTPESDVELKYLERPSHLVRLKPTGVQKTERPYDSGTTESKIAMEIREMREREEELRVMRERLHSPEGSNLSSSPQMSPTSWSQLSSQGNVESPEPGPGYRVSTVFGHKGTPSQSPVEEEKKVYRSFSKESAVDKEIRIARNREEELRKEKGLPPREDDSYIKPSQVKNSQVRVFGKMNHTNQNKELATTKIQQEIEEQTLREMALREMGHIQTISQERTDSKVAKLKDLDVYVTECTSPTSAPNGHRTWSDVSSKRSTPSPTGSSQGTVPPMSPRPVSQSKGISMQKFIASKGKETTFIVASSRNGPSHPEPNADVSRSNPVIAMTRNAKRTVSVESKIQQEILEMKLREEELRRQHNASTDQPFLTSGENGTDQDAVGNDETDYVNGQELNGNDVPDSSLQNSLIAQWEQRIQKAEGRA